MPLLNTDAEAETDLRAPLVLVDDAPIPRGTAPCVLCGVAPEYRVGWNVCLSCWDAAPTVMVKRTCSTCDGLGQIDTAGELPWEDGDPTECPDCHGDPDASEAEEDVDPTWMAMVDAMGAARGAA